MPAITMREWQDLFKAPKPTGRDPHLGYEHVPIPGYFASCLVKEGRVLGLVEHGPNKTRTTARDAIPAYRRAANKLASLAWLVPLLAAFDKACLEIENPKPAIAAEKII